MALQNHSDPLSRMEGSKRVERLVFPPKESSRSLLITASIEKVIFNCAPIGNSRFCECCRK